MNATQFVELVENRLGWDPASKYPKLPYWKAVRAEAGQVNKKVASDPDLYTYEHLALAVELLVRERKQSTPLGVFAHVERALSKAPVVEEVRPLEDQIADAVDEAVELGEFDWADRLVRASGQHRAKVLEEWANR